MRYVNPRAQRPADLARDRRADTATLVALLEAWPADQATVSTHALADAWRATLTREEVDAIQAAHPRGLGEYIDALLGEAPA